jgi:integrase
MDTVLPAAPASAAPARDGNITIRALADAYMARYAGRDHALLYRLTYWVSRLGDRPLREVTDDDAFEGIQALEALHGRYYAGTDADGKRIMRAKRKPLAPATLNRYLAALSLVLSWAQRQRMTPRGWTNPCRGVEFRREDNARVRFLSDAERAALLEECRRSKWPRLYLLVLMAITTGARRGELMSLRWRDINLESAVALVERTKNNDRKTLPLTPAVIEELRRHRAALGSLVFASKQRPDQPMAFEPGWKKAVKTAGIRDFRFHDLRHSCASYLAQNGATLLEIADVLGHRQIGMTRRYSHLTTHHKAGLINRVLGGMK